MIRVVLLALLLAASGCTSPEPRLRDNDPMADWYSDAGPYRRGEIGSPYSCDELRR